MLGALNVLRTYIVTRNRIKTGRAFVITKNDNKLTYPKKTAQKLRRSPKVHKYFRYVLQVVVTANQRLTLVQNK